MQEELNRHLSAIVIQLNSIDKRFDEQNTLFDLKLENQKQGIILELEDKSKKLAQKTIDDTLKGIGINVKDFSDTQKDLVFLRWLRVLCTNSFTRYLSYGFTLFFCLAWVFLV